MELQVSHLCKAYGGKSVLRDVSFSAGPGLTCITAPSGGGKTTLLRLVLGLEAPDSGTISGLEAARLSAVFQEDRLLANRDAAGNLRFVLGSAYRSEEAGALLERLGLSAADTKPVREYSGGMKRRLSLARALLAPFDLLALDEPFTGLDAENRRRAAACIRSYAQGKIVLLAAHAPEDAAEWKPQMVQLKNP